MSSAGSLWAELVGQESVDEIADSLFTTASVRAKEKGLQERGTENYLSRLVGRGRKRALSEVEAEEDGEGGKQPEEAEYAPRPFRDYESDSEISQGGLSDDSYEYIMGKTKAKKKSIKERIARYKKAWQQREEEDKDTVSRTKLRKVEFEGGSEPGAQPVSGPKGEKSKDEGHGTGNETKSVENPQPDKAVQESTWKTKHLERLQCKKDNEGVVFYITKRLHEKKGFLIRNAVQILGRDTCTRLFIKTAKINYYGGLLIKRGDKKRTMGGTFMYLIKNDTRIPEEKKAELLEANLKSESEKIEYQDAKKYEEAMDTDQKMNVFKNKILGRMNPSVLPSKSQVWNIDDNDDYAVQQPVPPPNPEDRMPKRKAVDYSDLDPFF